MLLKATKTEHNIVLLENDTPINDMVCLYKWGLTKLFITDKYPEHLQTLNPAS